MLPLLLSLMAAAPNPVPPPARLVVLDVVTEEKGLKSSTLSALSDLVTLELTRYASLDVLSGREIRAALKLEGEKQSLGCDDQSCAGEIANAFGARYVVFLVLVRLGSAYTLNLSLFDSTNARIVGRAAAQSDTIAGFQPLLTSSLRTLVSGIVKADDLKPAPLTKSKARETAPTAGGISTGRPAYPALADDEVPLTDEPLSAEDATICAYDASIDRFHCGAGPDGDSVLIEARRSGGASTAGVVRFVPQVRGGCLEGVDVEITSGDENVVVDWRDAVFVVDGVAVPARPLRPYERPVTAPAGVVAHEMVVPLSGRCIGPPSLASDRESDSVALTLGFVVGNQGARAKWLRVRARESVPEVKLIALLPPVEAPTPLPDASHEEPGSTGLIIGAATGGVIGALFGTYVAVAWMPKSSGVTSRTLAGSGYGALCMVCVGLPALAAGGLYDSAEQNKYRGKRQVVERYELEKKRYEAFKRAQSGND